ncbi:MAG TPA: hypothetical protein VH560_12545 [Polyangia bacterium]|jgi:hypothetical protein|nr:hypothetical protein [Polyangia bacterium]
MRRAGLSLSALALALAACGGGGGLHTHDAGADGGVEVDGVTGDVPNDRGEDSADADADVGLGEPLPAGFRAYDVTATLTLAASSGEGDFSTFPTTIPFTFAWDPGTGVAYSGSSWGHGKLAVATTDNQTFQPMALFFGAALATACTGEGTVVLDHVSFTVDGGALRGMATGDATYATNAGSFTTSVMAVLVGSPDVTPPTFTSLGMNVDPLAPILLEASEVLPKSASASLLSSPHGDLVPLNVAYTDNQETAVHAFASPGLALRYGETYSLVTDDVTDFAGNKPTSMTTFTTRADPPLVPEDGFESVTGTMFAGAGVLNGGPLIPIAGTTSLLLNTGYGGGFGFLPYDLGPSLAVRLIVPPGATKVSFDAELIAPDPIDAASFVGDVRFGSVGGTVVVQENVAATGFVKETLPELGDIYLSPVQTVTLALPPDATGQIAFEIVGQIDLCTEPPSPTVLVVDNLRVE